MHIYVYIYIHILIFTFRDYEILSEFTIALFEDTGWYKANYSALYALNQQKLHWGKGRVVSYNYMFIKKPYEYVHNYCTCMPIHKIRTYVRMYVCMYVWDAYNHNTFYNCNL